MALITDMGKVGASGGILMPMITNKWKIVSISCLNEDESDISILQAISLKYQFNPGVAFGMGWHDLQIVFEEDTGNRMSAVVRKLMLLKDYDITIANVDGEAKILKLTTFKKCRGAGYDYKLDYANSEACKFPLKFGCEDIVFN